MNSNFNFIKTATTFCLLAFALFTQAVTGGDFRNAFAGNGKFYAIPSNLDDGFYKTLVQPDGKILAIGTQSTPVPGITYSYITRLNADGTPDQSFGYGGAATVFGADANNTSVPFYIANAPGGKIVVLGITVPMSGADNDLFITQFKSDGTFDSTFNFVGTAWLQNASISDERPAGLAVSSNGQIYVAENFSNSGNYGFMISRINSDGNYDIFNYGNLGTHIFNESGKYTNIVDVFYDNIEQRLYAVGGIANVIGADQYPFVAAYGDHSLDSSFAFNGWGTINSSHPGAGATSAIWKNNNGFAVSFANYGAHQSYIYNFTSLGLVDNSLSFPTFPASGIVVESLAQQADGKIVYGGMKDAGNNKSLMIVGRFQYSGGIDSTFGNTGYITHTEGDSTESVKSLQITYDGYIVGGSTVNDGNSGFDYFLFELEPENIAELYFSTISTGFGNIPAGNTSNTQVTTLFGEHLTNGATVTATSEFEISTNGNNWSQSISLLPGDFDTSASNCLKIYYRFHPTSVGAKTGMMISSAIALPNDTVFFTGTGITPTGINHINDNSFALFPNPVNDVLHINASDIVNEILITDLQGRIILTEQNFTAENIVLDTSPLVNGNYLCVIQTEMGVAVKRFIKE